MHLWKIRRRERAENVCVFCKNIINNYKDIICINLCKVFEANIIPCDV